MTYSEKLKDPRWQKKRLEILSRDKFACKICNDEKSTLHVHHLKYLKGKDPWEYPKKDLATLCFYCHNEITMIEKTIKGLPGHKVDIERFASYQIEYEDLILIFSSYLGICFLSLYINKIWQKGGTISPKTMDNLGSIFEYTKVSYKIFSEQLKKAGVI